MHFKCTPWWFLTCISNQQVIEQDIDKERIEQDQDIEHFQLPGRLPGGSSCRYPWGNHYSDCIIIVLPLLECHVNEIIQSTLLSVTMHVLLAHVHTICILAL